MNLNSNDMTIVNKINHKHTFYAFVDGLEYEFQVIDGKIKSQWMPVKYYKQIKKELGL